MKRNYFIILCLLLVSSFVFAQKETTVKDLSGPPFSLAQGKGQQPYSPPSSAVAKSVLPAAGDNVLFSEDFNTDFDGVNYAPSTWDSYNFDSGLIWDGYTGGMGYNYYDSYWMGAFSFDGFDLFVASFSALVTRDPLAVYNGPADDWLVTPVITIGATDKDVALFFDVMSLDAGYLDGIQVWVIESSAYDAIATKTSSALVDASTMIYSSDEESAEAWTQHALKLNDYKDKTVRIMFRNNGFDKFAIALDNVYISLENALNPDDMNPARNLEVEQDGFHVNLAWELDLDVTLSEFGWANSSQTVVTAWSLSGDADIVYVSRFATEDLTAYDDEVLAGIKFGALNNSLANFSPLYAAITVQVYQGGTLGDPGTLILEQPVSSWDMGWNEVVFDDPITIDASKELWFGLKVVEKTTATVSSLNSVRNKTYQTEIPYVANKSDVLSIDGEWTTWKAIVEGTSNDDDLVWAFSGIIMNESSGAPSYLSHITPKPEKRVKVDKEGNIQSFKKPVVNPERIQSLPATDMNAPMYSTGAKALLLPKGYNIYRDGELLATTKNTSYTDEFVVDGGILYNYCVTAKYGVLASESVPVCKAILFEEIPAATELSTTFEGFTDGEPLDGWAMADNGGANWEFNDTWDIFYGALGDPSPFEDGSYAWFDGLLWYDGGIGYLTTPYIMPTAEKPNLRFELRNGMFSEDLLFILELLSGDSFEFNAANAPDFKVNVSADQGRTWTTVYDIKTDFPGYPYVDLTPTVNVDLSAYVDKPIFVQFFAQCNRNTTYIAMDNVELVEKYDGPCQPVTGLTAVQGDDTNTITVSWNSIYSSPAPVIEKSTKELDSSLLRAAKQKLDKRAKSGKDSWITYFEGEFPYTWKFENNSYVSGSTTRYAWQSAATWSYGTPPAESFYFFDSFEYNYTTPASIITHRFNVTEDAKEMVIEIQELMLNANWKGAGERLYIDYSEDGGTTWTNGTENILASLTGYNSATTEVTEQVYDLSAYVGKSINVRFRGISDYGGCVFALHSVELPQGPPAPPVYTLSRNGEVIAENLVDITSYIDNDVNTTGTYVYSLTVYQEDDDCTSDPVYVTLNFISICDLYPVQNVAAVQDDKYITVTWDNPIKIYTYTESFENGLGDWVNVDADGDGKVWVNSSTFAHTGSRSASSSSFEGGVLHPDNWLIRSFDINITTDLTYWIRQYSSYYPEKYGVYIATEDPLTGGFDASKFTALLVEAPATATWVQRTVSLAPYVGKKVWIAFRNFETTDQWTIFVDDIQLTLSGEWDVPKNIYRNGELLASDVLGTSYVDKLRVSGTYEYCVSIPIENCETVPDCTSITAQVGEINTEFPNNELPYQWEVIVGDDAKWEFADTYAARDMQDAYVPFADGDGTFVWFNAAYWDYNDYSYLVSPYFEPIEGEDIVAFDLATVKTALVTQVGHGAQLYVDILKLDETKWINGTENYLKAIPGYNKASHNMDLAFVDVSAYRDEDIKIRFRAVSDHGSFITAIDNVRLTNKKEIYDCNLNPVTDLTATVESDGVSLLWDAPAKSVVAPVIPTDDRRRVSEAQANVLASFNNNQVSSTTKGSFSIPSENDKKSNKATWVTRFENGIPAGWVTENNTYEGSYPQTAWQPHTNWDTDNYGTKPGASFIWFDAFNFEPSTPANLITHEFPVSNEAKTLTIEIQEATMDPQYRDAGEQIYIDYSTDGGSTWINGTVNILASLSGYNSETTAVTKQTYDLSAYVGKNVKVRFRGVSDYGACLAILYSVELPGGGGPQIETIYAESFEISSEWLFIDNSTTASWNMQVGVIVDQNQIPTPYPLTGDTYLISGYDDNNSRNAWALSPAVALVAGTEYTVSIYFYGQGWQGGQEQFKLTAGTARTEAGQTTVIVDKTMTATSWTLVSGTFIPTTSGDYYFGVNHCSAADRNAVGFEDFKIEAISPSEFGENDAPLTYTVTRDGAIIAEGLTNVSYKDTEITPEDYGIYEYAVIAVQGLCTSDEATVTVEIGPDCDRNKVSTLVADVDNDVVKLNWNAYDRSVTRAFDVYENGVKIAEGVTAYSLDIVPAASGYIDYCIVALSENCESEPACSNVYYVPTNISKVNGKIAVYPTITTGKVTVETPANANVKVTNVSGRLLETAESTGKLQLDLNYSNGVYLVIIDMEGVVSTHKVVVKK